MFYDDMSNQYKYFIEIRVNTPSVLVIGYGTVEQLYKSRVCVTLKYQYLYDKSVKAERRVDLLMTTDIYYFENKADFEATLYQFIDKPQCVEQPTMGGDIDGTLESYNDALLQAWY